MANNSIWNSIRTKILLIFGLTALPFLAVLIIVENSFETAFNNISSIHQRQDAQTFLLGDLQHDLKGQMLNWKNLLLRGQDPSLYHKHLDNFFSHERAVLSLLRKLRDNSADGSLVTKPLQVLADTHRELGKSQRKAIRVYNSPVENAAGKADLAVSHSEEQTVIRIKALAGAIEEEKNLRISSVAGSLKKMRILVNLSAALILVTAAAFLWWIASKGILAPVRNAVQAAQLVASGNLDHKINTKYTGEMGVLLLALDRMRVNLIKAITQRRKTENELRYNEQRFRDMIESSSDWFWQTDAQHRFSFVSERGPETLGLDLGQIIGKKRWEFPGNDQNNLFWRDHRHNLKNHRPFRDLEYLHVSSEKKNIAVSVNGIPVFDDDEKFLGYRGTARDVTERRQAERALVISEDRFTKSQKFANIGTWDWNIQTDKLYWSERIAPLFGYPTEELETTYDNFVNAIHPDDRQSVVDAVNACIEEGAEYNIEHRTVWPDGSLHYLLEKGDVVRDENDKPLNMLGVVQDITSVKLAELALAKSEARYREIIEGTEDLVTVVDGEGRYLFVNHKATDFLGILPEDILGKSVFDSVHPEDRRGTKAAFNDWTRNAETSVTYENRLQSVNGTVFFMLWAINIYYDDGGAVTMIRCIARDMTEYRAMQAQLVQSSKMATLGEMATGVAHELNQPLNIVRLALHNIQRKSKRNLLDPEYLNDKLDKIDNQIERASSIIDHMRIFGRKPDATPVLLNPENMVDNVLSLIGEQLRLAEIEVTTETRQPCRSILGHQVQVEQVLLNLLGNARDAVIEKEGDDKCILINVAENNGSVVIIIEDTGGGINANDLPRIFEPFYTTKEVGSGTGLGLSISYGIVKDMGGAISAENTGKGARLTVTLPACEEHTEAA